MDTGLRTSRLMRNVLEALQECGYEYDSSYNSFSGNSRYGKLDLVRCGTRIASKVTSSLFELPISNIRLGKKVIPVGGGGYFRLIPALLFMKAAPLHCGKGRCVFILLTPMGSRSRTAESDACSRRVLDSGIMSTCIRPCPRLSRLLKEFAGCRFVSCHDYIAQACGERKWSDGGKFGDCRGMRFEEGFAGRQVYLLLFFIFSRTKKAGHMAPPFKQS